MRNDAPDEGPERDVFAARLTPLPGPGGVNPAAAYLAQVVADALTSLSEKRTQEGKPALSTGLTHAIPSLTQSALGAVEGTLKSKSLDGALKEAQILAAYAETRERNANAVKLEAEAELALIAIARARLEMALEACKAFGVDPALVFAPGPTPTLVLGAGLATPSHESAPQPPMIAAADPSDELPEVGENTER
jgi:hypothetical protein